MFVATTTKEARETTAIRQTQIPVLVVYSRGVPWYVRVNRNHPPLPTFHVETHVGGHI